MIKTTYELNNVRKDNDMFDGKFTKNSPVVEVFAAMVNGEELSRFGAKADKAVAYIKELGGRADNGDWTAVSELNTLRKFVVEAPVLEEIKLLGVFGTYTNVGFDESIEREVYTFAGEKSREQAALGDVVFPAVSKEKYPVPTHIISGGYAVDYRKISNGDMTRENEGMALVRTDIRNKSMLLVVSKIYDAIKNTAGVKCQLEASGLTQAGVDNVLKKIRRYGKPTVIGDYSVVSQFNDWAGFNNTVATNTIMGMSEKAMNEIAANGILSQYKGAVIAELPNPYNEYELTSDGNNFKTILPEGLAFVIPAGTTSPVATWTRGGLTSLTGNNVKTGKVETRFDLEVAVDVAKGQENRIGAIYDTAIGGID